MADRLATGRAPRYRSVAVKTRPRLSWLPFLACLPALIFMIHEGVILATGPASIALQVAGVLLNFWARLTFRARSFHADAQTTTGALVTKGPYGIVRHPVYASLLVILSGALVAHPISLAFACVAFLVVATLTRIFLEECLLREAYPEYADYSLRVKRIIPGIR